MAWKKISKQTLFTHPRITLEEDIVELPNGVQVPYLLFKNNNDSACIICVKGDQVLLQQEYSYPPNEVLYQFPGGKVEPGEPPVDGVIRELAEETGLQPGHVDELGWFYVDNRRTSARMYVYLASDCSEVQKKGGDIEEETTEQWAAISDVDAMIQGGKIVNYSILAAWSLFKAHASSRP